jgi:FkbM family methyltransferase
MWWQLHAPRLARIGLPDVAPELWVIRRLRGVLAVDVGAYVGYFAILLSQAFRNIYAFEPHPLTRTALIRNLRANKVGNATVLPFAVGTKTQESATLYVGQKSTHSLLHDFAGGHLENRDASSSSLRGARTISVPVRTLAEVFSDRSLDLVKVDVEGAEFDVVNGSKAIMPRIKRWLIEVHYSRSADFNRRKQRMQDLLEGYGYKTWWIDDFHIYAERQQD